MSAAPPPGATPFLAEDVIASVGEAIVLADAGGRITLANQAAEQLLRVAGPQIIGVHVDDLFRDNPRLAAMAKETVALEQGQSSGEERLRLRECSSEIPIRVSCSPILARDGTLYGVALVIQDLSYQRKLEDEARRNETLARLGSLVASLAHEIKNPLGGIRGAAQLLARRSNGEPTAQAHTDIIVREVDRLSDLVEQLLTFGAPRRPAMERINVHQVLRDVIEILGPELDRRGVRLRMEIDPSLPEIRGDAAQLIQVFLNLLTNAVDVVVDGGQIVLSTRIETDFHINRRRAGTDRTSAAAASTGQFIRVGVADDGPGFPVDLGERVFEPFVTTKERGSGLGLAICERIVAAHGGDIRAENRREGGALVIVNLPVAR